MRESMKLKSKEICKRIENIPIEELPDIHYELCCQRWPKALGTPPSVNDFGVFTHVATQHAEDVCGLKGLLRWRKVTKDGYSSKMFEDWYDSNYICGMPRSVYIEKIVSRLRQRDVRWKRLISFCFLVNIVFCLGVTILVIFFC